MTFYFGFKAMPNLEEIADNLPKTAWRKLLRPPRYEVQTEAARRSPPTSSSGSSAAASSRCFRLKDEDYAEFEYQPGACQQPYRMVVLRKNDLAREGPAAAVRRDPLLLLHHQRLGDATRKTSSSRPTTAATRRT